MAETCKDCFYSREAGNPEAVLCQRYPPTITKVDFEKGLITANSPFVNNSWWCGEWKRRVNGNALSESDKPYPMLKTSTRGDD